MSKRNLIAELKQLSVAERLELIEDVWESLEDEAADGPIPDWQKILVDERLDALDAGTSVGAPLKEVMDRLRSRT